MQRISNCKATKRSPAAFQSSLRRPLPITPAEIQRLRRRDEPCSSASRSELHFPGKLHSAKPNFTESNPAPALAGSSPARRRLAPPPGELSKPQVLTERVLLQSNAPPKANVGHAYMRAAATALQIRDSLSAMRERGDAPNPPFSSLSCQRRKRGFGCPKRRNRCVSSCVLLFPAEEI